MEQPTPTKMKLKEFTIRKLDNNKHTVKTQDGSFKASGGETEVSFTFPEGTDVDKAIEFTKEKLKDLRDPDPEWLKQEPKEYRQKHFGEVKKNG